MHTLLRTLAVMAVLALPLTTYAAAADDPYAWLEEVQGERALAWVRERNAESRAVLEAQPRFAAMRERFLEILDAKDKIPYVSRQGDALLQPVARRGAPARPVAAHHAGRLPQRQPGVGNAARPRRAGSRGKRELGLAWRGLPRPGLPALPDLAVARRRRRACGARVRHRRPGASSPPPRAVSSCPKPSPTSTWVDDDTIYVGTDFGPGSMTDSGYPRIIKRWRRGQAAGAMPSPCSKAACKDVAVCATVDRTPGFERTLFGRATDFYNTEAVLLQSGKLVPIDRPSDAKESFWRQRLLLAAAQRLDRRRSHLGQGFAAGDRRRRLSARRAPLHGLVHPDRHALAGRLHDHRAHRCCCRCSTMSPAGIEEWRPAGQRWLRRAVAAPYPGTLGVEALHDPLLPRDTAGRVVLADLHRLPDARFAAAGPHRQRRARNPEGAPARSSTPRACSVEQRFARSQGRHARALLRGLAAGRHGRWPPTRPCSTATAASRFRMQPWYSGGFGSAWYRQGRCPGGGQHPRRRRVRAGLAPGGRARPSKQKQLRRLRRRGRGPDRAPHHQPTPPGHRRRQQRRPAGRRGDAAAPRAVQRRGLPGAAARHAALSQAAGRRELDGRVRRPRPSRRMGLHRPLQPVPEREARASSCPRSCSPPAPATTACTPATPARWPPAWPSRATRCCTTRTSKAATAARPTTASTHT